MKITTSMDKIEPTRDIHASALLNRKTKIATLSDESLIGSFLVMTFGVEWMS
jgi:hypothetical protein